MIDSDDEDEEHKLDGFYVVSPSQLVSEMDLVLDNLASLMRRALE